MSSNEKSVLIIGQVWPEPTATAAGQRMMHLLNFFKNYGYQIFFGSAASKTDYSENLEELGIEQFFLQINDPGFDELLLDLTPDLVVFDRFMTEEQFGWRVAETLPQSIRILNTEDLHSLRSVREKAKEKDIVFEISDWAQADITKRELASIFRCDINLIISKFETKLLQKHAQVSDDLLFYFPLFYGKEEKGISKTNPAYVDRSDFVFIGNGRHRPNLDAIQWLKEIIWPMIRRDLPETRLHIYGAYLPDQLHALDHPESGFLVHGYAESSRSVLQKARVNLAPLRYGAGLKGKILEAIQNGTPSVGTDIAWEGLVEGDLGIKVSDPTSFAREAVELYSNETSWEERQASHKLLFDVSLDRNKIEHGFQKKLIEISAGLETHRANNLFGSLLMHHTAASTKYMSKWIEAKNNSK